ncbi:hypothetical protein WME98_34385 [Sorangium sp. So ce296]|uniref:hypothetical protein n=1 Tax=Sorangium sp. So ce296 TaxID=3133296 RepID=UPI003F602B59
MHLPSPHELLVAETEAFPFVSMEAYRGRTLALTRAHAADEDASTAALGHALEDRLRLHANGLSLDALRQIRLRAWFFRDPPGGKVQGNDTVPLHQHLERLASTYLDFRGRRAILSQRCADPIDPGASSIDALHLRAMRYRWLTLRLPPDLLVSALASKHGVQPESSLVDLTTPHLARVLERDVADTHLHIGQGTSFGDVWRSLMAQLASGYDVDAVKLDAGEGVPDYAAWGDPKQRGDRYHRALLLAALVRLWLARFLSRPSVPYAQFLGALSNQAAASLVWPEAPSIMLAAHRALRNIEATPSRPLLRKLYVGLACAQIDVRRQTPGPVTSTLHKSAAEILKRDPACAWLHDGDPEMALTRRGLAYLAACKQATDPDFALAFWQYQRLRCMTYNFVTQDPGVGGLDWFQRFSRRLGPLRRPLDGTLVTSAHTLQGSDVQLKSLEVRETPRDDWSVTWRSVRGMARQLRELPRRPQAGVVLHFIKRRDPARDEPDGARWAFGAWSLDQWKAARSTELMLEQLPETLVLLRGLDVASAELSMPLWPTLRPLRHLRDASQRAAVKLSHRRPTWNVPPLRVTYHAGEDFRRLAEGIRRVHELVCFRVLEAGDRVGHGLALGIDPERWAERARCIEQPQAERLDDLLWELDLYGRGWLAPSAARVERVRSEAARVAERIHGEPVPIDALLVARKRRHDPVRLAALGYPSAITPAARADTADVLMIDGLRRPEVFRRGLVPIEVAVDAGEVEFLRAASHFVRRELTRLEITVETNPSSNLLIGRYESIDEHPIFRMFPRPGHERPGEVPVLVSLNVDDPVAFASRTADEYAHVYFALLRGRVPASEALDWLDRVRKNGYDSRFTVEASRAEAVLSVVAMQA